MDVDKKLFTYFLKKLAALFPNPPEQCRKKQSSQTPSAHSATPCICIFYALTPAFELQQRGGGETGQDGVWRSRSQCGMLLIYGSRCWVFRQQTSIPSDRRQLSCQLAHKECMYNSENVIRSHSTSASRDSRKSRKEYEGKWLPLRRLTGLCFEFLP